MACKIAGLGTAVPPYKAEQAQLKKMTSLMFKEDVANLDRLLSIFDNACIEARYLAQPLEWYAQAHSFAEANARYLEVAPILAEQAATAAIQAAGTDPAEIDAILFVSSTGIATPTIDGKLIQKLGLSRHTRRLPIWGLGCAGGIAGLARAAELARKTPQGKTLLVAVELCSLTFQRNDCSKSNIVGSGLFGDGAAAAILAADGTGPEVLGSYSTLFDASEDVMGWDIVDSGFKVRFSRDIPAIVRKNLPSLVRKAGEFWKMDPATIRYYVAHPGGVKVLEAYADSLGLAKEQLAAAYHILAAYGNMSSVSVLFVLQEFLHRQAATGDYGVMLALGPGFCAEQVLFRW
ncbi:Hypothetical protein LUCI_2686 [Lucifera butyrica]|uniref:Uncharacterized protein n=1 Tax=Lucifera butyrica TaxID=1351585 RepID=A0A498R914_9FIRM|nr:3-oxoacyl-[acyl-carrier-protein] synthase III C-terminal domain-containing protein [Lucifera butyrica]VBB07437.1 Hypothetical protein LUCI_2686 [Lucifera butyrica]